MDEAAALVPLDPLESDAWHALKTWNESFLTRFFSEMQEDDSYRVDWGSAFRAMCSGWQHFDDNTKIPWSECVYFQKCFQRFLGYPFDLKLFDQAESFLCIFLRYCGPKNVEESLKLDRLLDLLDRGADVNSSDGDSNTPLMIACQLGFSSLAGTLIAYGADVNATNNNGQTALHFAVRHPSTECVEFLLKNQADVDAADVNGQTPIFSAAFLQSLTVLLQHQAKVNVEDLMGNNPLHLHMMRSRTPDRDLLSQLISHGVDVNQQNRNGWTPLFYLVFAGTSEFGAERRSIEHNNLVHQLIETLLKWGADVNLTDFNGLTVAHYCALSGQLGTLNLLLPSMVYNIVSLSGETVKDCLKYYFRGEFEEKLKMTLKVLNKKPDHQCPPNADYAASSGSTLANYYRYNKSNTCAFDNWNEQRQFRSYKERHKAKQFWDRLASWNSDLTSLLKIVDHFSVGEFHFTNQCGEEKCQIGRNVYETLKHVLLLLKQEIDPIFEYELLAVGSTVDGSKFFLPDEFDFLLVVPDDQPLEESWLAYLQVGISEAIKLAISRGFATDSRLKFQFAECVKLPSKICYKLAFTWRGKQYPHLNISVDLSPVHRCPWSQRGQHLSDRYLGRWNPDPSHCKEFFITSDPRLPQTIPTLECLVISSNPMLQRCYRFLKLLVLSTAINKSITKGTYNVKTALLNYSRDGGVPATPKMIPAFCLDVLEKYLLKQRLIPKFGFVPKWNVNVDNWCYLAHKQEWFPNYRKLFFFSTSIDPQTLLNGLRSFLRMHPTLSFGKRSSTRDGLMEEASGPRSRSTSTRSSCSLFRTLRRSNQSTNRT